MLTITYIKKAPCPLSKAKVQKIITTAARLEPKIAGSVEIIIVNDAQMRKLNLQHRGKNSTTDVLSFAWQEDADVPNVGLLGEIYLCYAQIARQAKRFSCSVAEETARMLTHGLLHLVGYDHVKKSESKRMFALQEKIVGHLI